MDSQAATCACCTVDPIEAAAEKQRRLDRATQESRGHALKNLAIWGSLVAVGLLIVSLWGWLAADLMSSMPARDRASSFLSRLTIVTGAIASVAGIARLIGHDEQTPGKPIDALGKALGLWAALFAAAYASVAFIAVGT